MTSSGNSDSIPIGSILAWNNNSNLPNDYLICNGSTFDINQYPKLYRVLGTNILPNMNNSLQTDFDGYYATGLYHKTTSSIKNSWGTTSGKYLAPISYGILYFDSFKDAIHFNWNIKWIIKAR